MWHTVPLSFSVVHLRFDFGVFGVDIVGTLGIYLLLCVARN